MSATEYMTLTPDALETVKADIYADPMHYDDPQCLPQMFHKMVTEVGEVAVDPGSPFAGWASDLLRALALRAKSGIPFGEPQEPLYLETLDEVERTNH